ncbi:MAG: radical SAM protein [Clostridia bacterium]|nr:radical SAM protein [Clostridia bacterium]
MKVNEIFLSVQGESLSAGFPTIFVRFTGCNLRCSYCDTSYAYEEGRDMHPIEIHNSIKMYGYQRVCLTGGEPLLQEGMGKLLSILENYNVTIETNGSVLLDSAMLGDKHSFVMDVKTPSSGCSDHICWENFDLLSDKDEIKFVIGNREDYEWSREIIKKFVKKGTITFSPVFGKIPYADIVEWILFDRLNVRFQLQMHKLIWNPAKRGV